MLKQVRTETLVNWPKQNIQKVLLVKINTKFVSIYFCYVETNYDWIIS